MEYEYKVKSEDGGEKSSITFVNHSNVPASLNWFDFDGKLVEYEVIEPGGSHGMQTFVGHPWACIDKTSGKTMLTGGVPVYYPIASSSHYDVVIGAPNETNAGFPSFNTQGQPPPPYSQYPQPIGGQVYPPPQHMAYPPPQNMAYPPPPNMPYPPPPGYRY